MAFVSGPRQSGKTYLAKHILDERGSGKYHNWDDVEFRRAWVKEPKSSVKFEENEKSPVFVFDEIHKAVKWKQTLKGIYDYWTDTGRGHFEMYYLRNKEKCEIDFLITNDGNPWMVIECKDSDVTPGENFNFFMSSLGCSHCVQLVRIPEVWKIHEKPGYSCLVASAQHVLSFLP